MNRPRVLAGRATGDFRTEFRWMEARHRGIVLALALALVGWTGVASATRIGGGIHYLRNLGDIEAAGAGDVSFDENSISLLGSVQSDGGLLRLEAQVEYVFSYLGTDEAMWQPSLWIVTQGTIYGGGGMGIGYVAGGWQDDPFYALRAGVNVPLAAVHLDVFATYRFQGADDFEGLAVEDLDSLSLGAVLRFAIGTID